MLKARLDRQLKGEAGLAAAGAAGQGDEPVVAQELAELSELFRSPDEARQLRGQGLIRAHWLLALQRSQRRDRPILLISILKLGPTSDHHPDRGMGSTAPVGFVAARWER